MRIKEWTDRAYMIEYKLISYPECLGPEVLGVTQILKYLDRFYH